MNFVIMAYSFPPRSGPECFCSARFASALACAGHSVHVVTMDHPVAVSKAVYDVVVDRRIRVTRVPMRPVSKRIWPRLRYLTTQWESADYDVAIRTLASVLRQYDKPVLISRSNPESSHIIAFHARQYAYRWIAHFSDPIPFGKSAPDLKSRLWRALTLRWMRKAIRSCDGVSLTCPEVVRFYHETYGALFDAKPVFINYHVGEPALKVDTKWEKPFVEKFIVHMGMMNPARGACQIIEALDALNKDSLCVRFVQVGECGAVTRKLFEGQKDVLVLQSADPDLGAAVANVADVSFIPDVQINLPYTPFMPSKFVYQLFSDKPLVLCTRPSSPMHALSASYPEAGLFVANYEEKGSLAGALRQALAVGVGAKRFDRMAIRGLFTRLGVGQAFCGKLTETFPELGE